MLILTYLNLISTLNMFIFVELMVIEEKHSNISNGMLANTASTLQHTDQGVRLPFKSYF